MSRANGARGVRGVPASDGAFAAPEAAPAPRFLTMRLLRIAVLTVLLAAEVAIFSTGQGAAGERIRVTASQSAEVH